VSGLVQRVEKVIAKHGLLKDGDVVLVGVSGGVDSMVLLHVLHALARKHAWNLVVAHLHHGLRGRAADLDEQFVARRAKRYGFRFESAREDVRKFARLRTISVEMAARQLRHEFLARTARALGIGRIALGHHAGDQVELFFLRLFRGAGTQGFGGMDWSTASPASRKIKLVRPLLGVEKSELVTFARANRISFREDKSNRSTEILRNRIRRKLIPFLRREFQPQLGTVVLRSMELLRDDWDWVTMTALHFMETLRSTRSFAQLHVALQRRIMQIGLLKIGIAPRFELVEALRAEPAKWVSVDSGLQVRRTARATLETRDETEATFQNEEQILRLDTRTGQKVFAGTRIFWNRTSAKGFRRKNNTEFFDADQVGSEVILRHWRAGDRFQPIGLKHVVKLQDWFVNQKISRECRHKLVLATTVDGKIFWIEGLRIGEAFKVTSATKRRLEWRWQAK
jgi:tRNA(Ile)-lysidine synthase